MDGGLSTHLKILTIRFFPDRLIALCDVYLEKVLTWTRASAVVLNDGCGLEIYKIVYMCMILDNLTSEFHKMH